MTSNQQPEMAQQQMPDAAAAGACAVASTAAATNGTDEPVVADTRERLGDDLAQSTIARGEHGGALEVVGIRDGTRTVRERLHRGLDRALDDNKLSVPTSVADRLDDSENPARDLAAYLMGQSRLPHLKERLQDYLLNENKAGRVVGTAAQFVWERADDFVSPLETELALAKDPSKFDELRRNRDILVKRLDDIRRRSDQVLNVFNVRSKGGEYEGTRYKGFEFEFRDAMTDEAIRAHVIQPVLNWLKEGDNLNLARKQGFKGTFFIEPKPCEPSKHQYDFDSATVIGFLRHFGLDKDFKINVEVNHATLAGHTFQHELQTAADAGMLGSIDANRGDEQNGWDTDQFPTDIYLTTQIMLVIMKQGGLAPGGTNFDAKVRRESIDPIDLFHAHIGGMDAFARGLKIAAAIRADGVLSDFVANRYSSYDSGIGRKIEIGTTNFSELEAYMLEKGEAAPNSSGRQEMLENIINLYI